MTQHHDQPEPPATGTPDTLARGSNGKYTRTLAGAERDAEAARLRSQGMPYRKIGAALGMSGSSAHDAVQRAFAAVVAEPAATAVAVELARLDQELVRLDALYAKVETVLDREHVTVSHGKVIQHEGAPLLDDNPVLQAADRLVRIEDARRRNGESRRKLLGLDQPAKVDIGGGVKYELVGIDVDALR